MDVSQPCGHPFLHEHKAPRTAVDPPGMPCATVRIMAKLTMNLRCLPGGGGEHPHEGTLPHTHWSHT